MLARRLTFYLFVVVGICILTVGYLLESDRTLYLSHTVKSYYITNFPIQLLNGIHNSLYHHYSPLRVVFPLNELSFHQKLLKHRDKILQEVDNYSFSQLQEIGYNASKDIKQFPKSNYHYIRLWFYGYRYPEAQYFPILDSLRRQHPEVRTMFFSLMSGPKHVPMHRGSYNGAVRYHFPIKGGSDTHLEILDSVRLSSTRPFIFDDTYPHSLTKTGKSIRIVLISDVDNQWSPFKSLQFHRYLDYSKKK